jgi:hypothetical protein
VRVSPFEDCGDFISFANERWPNATRAPKGQIDQDQKHDRVEQDQGG